MDIYRDLHANPELSFQEVRSAAKLAAAARKTGFEVAEKVGKTGVVAVMCNGPGPVMLIRADIDGLPVIEQTGLALASKRRGTSTAGVESGVMHACEHDTGDLPSGVVGTVPGFALANVDSVGNCLMALHV